MQIDNLIDNNPVISWISTLSKKVKITIFLLSIIGAIGSYYLMWQKNLIVSKCSMIVFFFLAFIIWNILIEVFAPKNWKDRISAFVTIVIAIVMVAGLVADPFEDFKRTLICSEINPDGVQVAEGYKFSENEDGSFSAKVYVKNTELNAEGKYISYEVFTSDNLQYLEVEWKNNTILVINGEEIHADYHYIN